MFKKFEVEKPVIKGRDYNISDFGAVADGKTSNTVAFKAAIEQASLEGGGRVIVPNGIYLTGPIELKSKVELHLSDNAIILFDKNPEEYRLIVTDFEGIARIRTLSPVYAENVSDIAITGKGSLNGNGDLWRPVKEFKVTKRQWERLLKKSEYVIESNEGGVWVPTKSIYDGRYAGEQFPKNYEYDKDAIEKASAYYDFYRPVMISIRNCESVLLSGIRIQNSPAWCLHPYFSSHVTIENVIINNPYYAQNGDGIDVESCKYVHIHHCDLQTGDDGICLKSGKDRAARAFDGPCENVYIHDCKVGMSHGGFVIGSEMSRGVRNVLVENCSFTDSDVGIRFKSAMGRGGVVSEIYLNNILMIKMKEESLIMTMDYVHNQMDYCDKVVQSEDLEDIPEFKNIYFNHCICPDKEAHYRIEGLKGHKESIHDIFFEDCSLGNGVVWGEQKSAF